MLLESADVITSASLTLSSSNPDFPFNAVLMAYLSLAAGLRRNGWVLTRITAEGVDRSILAPMSYLYTVCNLGNLSIAVSTRLI